MYSTFVKAYINFKVYFYAVLVSILLHFINNLQMLLKSFNHQKQKQNTSRKETVIYLDVQEWAIRLH